MSSKKVILIAKKDALSKLPGIVKSDDLCYFLADDYRLFLKLNEYMPTNVEVKNLSGIFRDTINNVREPFLDLLAGLGKQHDSLLWWGTHIASRNSASIPLLLNVINLHCAGQILDKAGNSNQRVVFIAESPALMECIAKLASQKGFHVVYQRRIRQKAISFCRLGLVYMARIAQFAWRNLQNRRCAFANLKPIPAKTLNQEKKIVIRTWITKDTFGEDGEYRDRNFGVLPTWLRSQGYEIWTLPMFFNLPGASHDIYRLMKAQGNHYLIPHHYLKLADYWGMILMGVKQLRIPLRHLSLQSMDITPIFREVQLSQGFNPDLLTSNLCYPMLKRIKEAGVDIERFYYPFENNAPEKPFVLGVHDHYPETEIIAYQHTVWYPDQLAMFLAEGEDAFHPMADRIICTGPTYLQVLKNARFPARRLQLGANLRFTSVHESRVPKGGGISKPKRILLPLTFDNNLANELIYKTRIALEEDSNDYQIYIRTHPLLSKTDLEEFLTEIKMTGFQYADEGIMQDWLPDSFAVISNASVTILESVIRVAPDNGFFYDPLAWSSYPIEAVNTPTEIRASLAHISKLLEEDAEVFRKYGKQVEAEYFTQVDENTLKAFA